MDWCLAKAQEVYNRPADKTQYRVVCIPTKQGEDHRAY